MIKISGGVVLAGLLLAGCTPKIHQNSLVTPSVVNQPVQQETAPAPAAPEGKGEILSATAPQPDMRSDSNLRIQQCRKELDAMRTYSKVSYDKYQAEFVTVASKTSKYLQIKDTIGADVNDVAMPGYQFQIRELCFRIKNRLSQLIIRQVQY